MTLWLFWWRGIPSVVRLSTLGFSWGLIQPHFHPQVCLSICLSLCLMYEVFLLNFFTCEDCNFKFYLKNALKICSKLEVESFLFFTDQKLLGLLFLYEKNKTDLKVYRFVILTHLIIFTSQGLLTRIAHKFRYNVFLFKSWHFIITQTISLEQPMNIYIVYTIMP